MPNRIGRPQNAGCHTPMLKRTGKIQMDSLPKFQIDPPPDLHMTAIRSKHWRERVGMAFNDSENRVAEAVRVIYSTGALDAVASVVKRSVLHEVFPKQTGPWRNKIGLDNPDYVCYMAYFLLVLNRVKKLHPDATKVNFVFSEKQETKKGMEMVVEATRRFFAAEDPEVAELFGECKSSTPEKESGLQAADLICWHLQCNYRGDFPRTDENRMWYLLKPRDGDLHEWSKDALKEFANEIASHRARKSLKISPRDTVGLHRSRLGE
jgi:hypothetical protein